MDKKQVFTVKTNLPSFTEFFFIRFKNYNIKIFKL